MGTEKLQKTAKSADGFRNGSSKPNGEPVPLNAAGSDA